MADPARGNVVVQRIPVGLERVAVPRLHHQIRRAKPAMRIIAVRRRDQMQPIPQRLRAATARARRRVISTCGCGEYSATLVVHAPRTVVRGVRVQSAYACPESCLTVDDGCTAERSAPATPPPKSFSC